MMTALGKQKRRSSHIYSNDFLQENIGDKEYYTSPALVELNRDLIPRKEPPIEYVPKEPKNPLQDYVEKRTRKEFDDFLSYGEDLKLTMRLRQLADKGKITIHNEPTEELEVSEKTKVFAFGFFIGVIISILLL